MIRILLTVILPILLPLGLYVAYVAYTRSRTVERGGEAAATRRETILLWVVLAAGLLIIIALFSLRFTQSVPPGTLLESPRQENGVIIPSQPKRSP